MSEKDKNGQEPELVELIYPTDPAVTRVLTEDDIDQLGIREVVDEIEKSYRNSTYRSKRTGRPQRDEEEKPSG